MVFLSVLGSSTAWAQTAPAPPDFSGIVKDADWARILGKALFWDTIAAARGANCSGCHFATDANLQIPDQSPGQVPMRRIAAIEPAAGDSPRSAANAVTTEGTRGLVDICSTQISWSPAEIADSGPIKGVSVATGESDPSCGEDLSARLARTLLQHKPLAARTIDSNDSTFGRSGPHGNLVSPTGRGLERTYQWMIQQAFEDTLWSVSANDSGTGPGRAPATSTEYRKVERNFPLFWGVAIMLYESSLDPAWSRFHGCAAASACDSQPTDSRALPNRSAGAG